MINPPVKWPGGKRWLAPKINALIDWDEIERRGIHHYCEPFLGGGAFFFSVVAGHPRFERSRLSDLNVDLIQLFDAIKTDCASVVADYSTLYMAASSRYTSTEYYYAVRDAWNQGTRSAAHMLYLSQNCFNGLWRVNKAGAMNTPWCREAPRGIDEENLRAVAHALQSADLHHGDFSETVLTAPSLIYLDPPYLESWTDYTQEGWTPANAQELVRRACAWSCDGHYVVLSHADNETMRALLKDYWPYGRVERVQARRSISCKADGRQPVGELVVLTK